jgi:hypothetical protein
MYFTLAIGKPFHTFGFAKTNDSHSSEMNHFALAVKATRQYVVRFLVAPAHSPGDSGPGLPFGRASDTPLAIPFTIRLKLELGCDADNG